MEKNEFDTVDKIIESLKKSINCKNWYVSLIVALILPDIIGKVEYYSEEKSSNRYINWFNKYVTSKDLSGLSGENCYALRCAYLHEGSMDIEKQSKSDGTINSFYFTFPKSDWIVNNNRLISIKGEKQHVKLQLQVDVFCKAIIEGIESWKKDIKNDDEKLLKLKEITAIHTRLFN